MAKQNIGVTIIVSLICGLFGGIVGGLISPAILGGILIGAATEDAERAQQQDKKAADTGASMMIIGTCMEAYAVDNGKYPLANSVVDLALRFEPTYVKSVPYEDGWGKRFLVRSNNKGYEIRSTGADGRANTKDDLVYSQGRLVQYPYGD